MGEVYRARDTTLGRGVAIKVLARIALDRSCARRAVRAGGEDARRAEPVNIAHIYGLARNDGDTSIVMELVEGQTLADRIAEGRLPIERRWRRTASADSGLTTIAAG